ncbi:hypothetical protein MNBD_GAMMA24-266 [hydrothermal vent metagenome]|uniref:Uncharacterized protein n=1 Tax=hydrothermal vent metagenome TaxID=652676 RepID=A0A3B1B2I5_9ZZZZ
MVKLAEGVGINHDKGYPASLFRDPMLERPDMMKMFYPALTMQDALGMIDMVYDNNYGAEQAKSTVAYVCAKLEPQGLCLFDKAEN